VSQRRFQSFALLLRNGETRLSRPGSDGYPKVLLAFGENLSPSAFGGLFGFFVPPAEKFRLILDAWRRERDLVPEQSN